MAERQRKALIMAGGTGGHVFPALAVARELQARGLALAWLGTAKGIEARLVPAADIPLHFLSVQGVRGRGATGLLKAPFLVLLAVIQALNVVRRFKPDVVVGFGGFASGPGGIAARLTGRPLVIHEQNAIPGTTNRYLASLASCVLTAFPTGLKNAVEVGNPVRREVATLPEPSARFSARDGQPLRLLVLGGSLGARAINEQVPEALSRLEANERPDVWHQCGAAHSEATTEHYRLSGVDARVEPFIEDMAAAYAWADWVICRAGALTVSELMSVGLAALMIPYPHAIDDHQTHNAAVLVDAGAALAVSQRDLDAEKLAALVREEFSDRPRLQSMAEKGRRLARPEAAGVVAEHCIEVSRG
ncbi:undecaprenyldiphospho-muramoylpentapeptide beta-N-acetylglucosaminyltransferase [Marinimicrobium agarilyticum]|uniref:undecaprenyldiphospho-muramoylpentapeptide beta-N-acetylglucosaminyltransferase n=1 Tax=Marinimicrobium agarilyticum TaxID=306546 RepID=UPI00040A9812|nr:undecaprenyldiphospho-muramoylpentapeptide beta-N-acetylglucosaminyltransferase [Marinimicrobium agarilyticum]